MGQTQEELHAALQRGRDRAKRELQARRAAADSAFPDTGRGARSTDNEGHSEGFTRGAERARAEREARPKADALIDALTKPSDVSGLPVIGGRS